MLQAFDGGAVFGERWGDGGVPPAVVALHGWGRSHTDFTTVLGAAAPGGALAALGLDLPGFGASPPPSVAWGSEAYADVIVRILEGPGGPADPVVLVGHSLGGRVAVRVAAARPDLVSGLVLSGAPVGPRTGGRPRPVPAFRLVRRLHRMGLVGDAAMERARQRHGSADYRAASGVMRDVLVRLVAEDYADAIGALACPVELVWGSDDSVVPTEVARSLAAAIPGARLTVCPAAGHLVPVTAPGDLRAAVDRLVTSSGVAAG